MIVYCAVEIHKLHISGIKRSPDKESTVSLALVCQGLRDTEKKQQKRVEIATGISSIYD